MTDGIHHSGIRNLAYTQTAGARPGVVFLGGFRSDKEGTKAIYLEDWAQRRGRAFLRFDYSGHGQSSGDFLDGAIGDWFDTFRTSLELHLDSYEQQKIEIVGDVAMVRSHASGHYLNKKSGEKLPLDQKYLDVLRYENGHWKMAYHVANSNTFDSGLWEFNWESQ